MRRRKQTRTPRPRRLASFEASRQENGALKTTPVKINWHSGLSIYASEQFLRTVGDEYGWLGGIDDTGKLRCVLPYTIVRKAMLRMVRFRIETLPLEGCLSVEEEKSFLTSVVDYFRSAGADMIIPASTNTIFRAYPDGAVAAPYGSYVIDLRKDEEPLFNQMSATHRKRTRQATRNGVRIKSGLEQIDRAYDIIKTTLKRSSMGFIDHGAFRRLIHGLGENVKLLIAEHEGIAKACTLFPFSTYCAYSLYGGSIAEDVPGAVHLLNWEAIRLFRNLGVERLDFVGVRRNPEPGSKQEGIMTFKRRFGGELKEGYIWKYPLHMLKYRIYALSAAVLRGGDIVDQEKHKLRPREVEPFLGRNEG